MIGITMGDANGIGPEIILRAFKEGRIDGKVIVIGDLRILEFCNSKLDLNVPLSAVKSSGDYAEGSVNVLDINLLNENDLTIGSISRNVGKAAVEYIKKAVELILSSELDGMVTLPINKEAIGMSFPGFMGHTDYIADMCDVEDYTMMLASEQLIVTHASMHVSMEQAIRNVKKERILKVIQLTESAVKNLRPEVRIAVAGLNPHAGEGGSFGNEELEEILPAVRSAQEMGINVVGPVPPDTVFFQAVNGKFDAVVCMYHDQGHIPMKLLDFEGGVNVTLGLPIIRTSVDHGTAYDIAWQGKASTTSFNNALKMAENLIQKK